MNQQVIEFSGVSYDYCESVTCYKLLGFFNDESKSFMGVEITQYECDLEDVTSIKRHLIQNRMGNLKLVCGNKDEKFQYYTLNMGQNLVSHGSLNCYSNRGKMFGRENSLENNSALTLKESTFRNISECEYVEDLELATLISSILENQKSNLVWKGLQDCVKELNSKQKQL